MTETRLLRLIRLNETVDTLEKWKYIEKNLLIPILIAAAQEFFRISAIEAGPANTQ